jgi:phage-related tail fiber protein
MANTLRIKRRATGNAGAPASLENAELAFNEVDNTLYYGKGTGGAGGTATTVIPIAGDGAFVALTGDQTVAGTKTFSSTVQGSVSGNAGTATKLATARNIALSGDATGTASFDGSANATIAATLATVNSNVGSFGSATQIPTITVNGKGLVTAVTTNTISTSFNIAGNSGTDTVNTGETITFTGTAPINTAVTNNAVTISAADATTTTKGVASFNSGSFAVTSGAVALAAVGTAGTYTKVTTDANGRVTSGTTLVAADIPNLDTSKITTGTFASARMPAYSGDASSTAGTTTLTLASVGTAGTYTKVTTDAKGRVTAGTTLAASDIPTLTASKISDFDTQVRTSRLDQMAAPTAAVSFNNQRITNVATPTQDTDAANKAYVDASRLGLDVKESVRVATTDNITLSGLQNVDGITLVAGDRVLVKNQTTASANGIYLASATAWTRAADFVNGQVTSGAFTFVEQGTENADSGWVLTTDGTITIGTTALAFAQFSGAGQISAGAGLTKTGNTIDVGTASTGRIVVNADNIDLATTGVAASTYRSVTVDAYGRVTAGTNPTTLAGYGITDALSNSTTSVQNGYFGDIFLRDDVNPSHYLQVTNSGDLTAQRTLSINVNDAARTISLSGNLTVPAAATVSGTNTGDQTITLTGDVTGSGTGSFATTLANSGVTAGTYRSVTVDTKGRVTAGTNPTTLAGYGITDAQPLNANLTSISGLSLSANQMIYATSANTFTTSTITAFGRSLIDDADAAAGRTTLGLGTMAVQNANNVAITGGTIDNITFDMGTF